MFSWTPLADDFISSLTFTVGYLVTVTDGNGDAKNTTVDGETLSAIFTRPVSPYSVRVHAVNGAGVGQLSNAAISGK
jgi:hypothetical protein